MIVNCVSVYAGGDYGCASKLIGRFCTEAAAKEVAEYVGGRVQKETITIYSTLEEWKELHVPNQRPTK